MKTTLIALQPYFNLGMPTSPPKKELNSMSDNLPKGTFPSPQFDNAYREYMKLQKELDQERMRSNLYKEGLELAMMQREKLRDALVRLRDCDWVITPSDRMDAVREIAREALEETK